MCNWGTTKSIELISEGMDGSSRYLFGNPIITSDVLGMFNLLIRVVISLVSRDVVLLGICVVPLICVY